MTVADGEAAGRNPAAVDAGEADARAGRGVSIERRTGPFSLVDTCGPVVWGGGRWPNVDWLDGSLIWCGWEGERVVWRRARQRDDATLAIEGDAEAREDVLWAKRVLGVGRPLPPFGDATVEGLRRRFPGLRAYAYGSLYEGLVTSIVGQSISLAAAAVTEARLSRLFDAGRELGGRIFWPLPRATDLGDASPALLRTSGVTWRRAEALVGVGAAAASGDLPDDDRARGDSKAGIEACRALPMVGQWTAASALLWGVAAPDVHPSGDAALLRAARRAYGETRLTRLDVDTLAEGWRPERAGGARLLWAGLFGGA